MRRGGISWTRFAALGASIGALFGLVGGCDHGAPASETTRGGAQPNVIFILVDTLRADRLGCYGRADGLSPLMDEWAAEGVLFERATAESSWTLPSVASFFCGFYPTVHKVTSYEDALQKSRVAGEVRYFGDEFTTLAEVLQASGYETAGFSANPFVTRKFGFAQGFEHFDSSFADNSTQGGVVNAAALKWLATRDVSKPFFMYLHYMDIHDPYKASAQFVEPLVDAVEAKPDKRTLTERERKRHVRYFTKSAVAYKDVPKHTRLFQYADYWQARYDSGVPQINVYLNELRAKLVELGLWDNALLVMTADHGESLGEHLIWAHGLSAHQDQLHVPLILRWPGRLPEGKRIGSTVRLFDVMPTLLELLEIDAPERIQARSLCGLIRGDASSVPFAFAEAVKEHPGEKALIVAQWKLLAYTSEDRYELYDLDADPTERNDLANQQPQRVEELKKLLSRQITENEALGRGVDAKSAAISEEERQRFQSLGYFDDDGADPDGKKTDNPNAPKEDPP